jgi:putative resolvase
MKISIKTAAKELGIAIGTLRRWEVEGRIKAERTPGGHRRYDLDKLSRLIPYSVGKKRITIAYARVSTSDQKKDLNRQIQLLENYCTAKGWNYELMQDLGSGLNYNKRGLKQLIRYITCNKVERLVLTHKDRLLRFGSEIIFSLCEQFDTEVVLIHSSEETTFEKELVQDVLEIITVFSARLYGSRSRKNKQVVEHLRGVIDENSHKNTTSVR